VLAPRARRCASCPHSGAACDLFKVKSRAFFLVSFLSSAYLLEDQRKRVLRSAAV